MTREEFIAVVGRPPSDDDLDRANCLKAGQIGHLMCGICEHGLPRFLAPCANAVAMPEPLPHTETHR